MNIAVLLIFFLCFFDEPDLAMNEGNWLILEPIMLVESSAPEQFQGALLAAISRRSGLIVSSESHGGYVTVEAEVS